jgi:hypothetical protein
VRSKSCTAGCHWSVRCAAAAAGPSHNTDRLRRTGHSPTPTRRDAIDAPGTVKCLDALSRSLDPRQQYADLFTGLGCLEGEYTIRLKLDAQPFAVFTPRRIPVNLLPLLKQELEKLQQAGVIKRVDEPTLVRASCGYTEEHLQPDARTETQHTTMRGHDSAEQCRAP